MWSLGLKGLNLIIHSCSFLKQNIKDVRGNKSNRHQGGHAATPAVTSLVWPHPQRPRGSQSAQEKRCDNSFQALD